MGVKSEDIISETFRDAHDELDKCAEIAGSQQSLVARIAQVIGLHAGAKRNFLQLAVSVDKAHGAMDAIPALPAGPGDIHARVACLVSHHKQALAKIEYLKTEFQKLAAYVLEEQEERHRAQRIIGGLMTQLDAANRKKAAEKLLN